MTNIEWTEETWNPVVGCSVVSPGCTNCYAMAMAARLERIGTAPQYTGTTQTSRAGPVWTGKVALAEKALVAPLKRRKPTVYFVNSMGDLFHEDVPDEWIDRVFAIMVMCPQHTFQVLTKRAERMRDYMAKLSGEGMIEIWAMAAGRLCGDHGYDNVMQYHNRENTWPVPNIWMGVSAEDQTRYNERKEHLRNTPAAVHFFSFEPLLGPIKADYIGEWAIVGGESGPNARPMHPDWARGLRDQCQDAGVPFFFKQWGEWAPAIFEADESAEYYEGPVLYIDHENCGEVDDSDSEISKYQGLIWMPDGTITLKWTALPEDWFDGRKVIAARRVGKKAAGRLLDGREWNGMPTTPVTGGAPLSDCKQSPAGPASKGDAGG